MKSVILALLLAAGSGFAPALAQETDGLPRLFIERHDVELRVEPDGNWDVTERITFHPRSGDFSFGARPIPTDEMDALTGLRAESPDLADFRAEVDSTRSTRTVRWKHAPSEDPGTVVLRYRVEGALRDLGDRNEIFWAAIGPESELPIERLEATVRLPSGFVEDAGLFEVDPHAAVDRDPEGWTILFAHDELAPGQGYQLRVSFPWVVDGRAQGLRRTEVQVALAMGALFLFGIGVALLGFERWRRGSRTPTDTPPSIPLEEAAVLLFSGPRAESAYPATILSLARRGHLTLVRGEAEAEGPFDPKERVVLQIHRVADDPLTDFEIRLLEELAEFESLEAFGEHGGDFRTDRLSETRDALLDVGLLRDRTAEARGETRRGFMLLAVSILLPITVLWFSPWVLAIAAGGFGLALGLLIRGEQELLPTEEGRRVQAELLGWFERLREELARSVEIDPLEGAGRYLQVLPWLSIDPAHLGRIEHELEKALDEIEADFPLPQWIENRKEEVREELEERSAARRAFTSAQETVSLATILAVPALASYGGAGTSTATFSGSMAGATGAGAAGGGGVSAG